MAAQRGRRRRHRGQSAKCCTRPTAAAQCANTDGADATKRPTPNDTLNQILLVRDYESFLPNGEEFAVMDYRVTLKEHAHAHAHGHKHKGAAPGGRPFPSGPRAERPPPPPRQRAGQFSARGRARCAPHSDI